jgi:cobalt-zinc-cadmium efflux system protein
MGMRKAESLASLLNGILLFLMSIWILHEAFERLESKENINPIAMLGYSATGLVANLMSLGLLHKHSKENMNVRSTYLHAMGDLLGTLGVVLGSVLIYFFQVQWIDIAVSMLICGFILKSSIQIILDSYVIINDGNLDIQASNELIQKIKDLGHLPFEIKILSKIHSHKKLILIWTNHFHEEDILHWEKKILEIDSQLELEHRYLSPQSTQNHESVFHTHHHHHH